MTVEIKYFPGASVDAYLREFGILPSEQEAATARVLKELCAKCDGELDTGWECNNCGWDGRPFALMIDAPRVRQ